MLSFPFMRSLFFVLLFLVPATIFAQSEHAVSWGFGTDLGFRLPALQQDHGFSGGLHSLRLDAFIAVRAPEDQGLGFIGMAGSTFRCTALIALNVLSKSIE